MVSSCLSLLNAKMASAPPFTEEKKLSLKKNPNKEAHVGIIAQNSLATVILQKLIIWGKLVNAMQSFPYKQ